MKKYKALSFIVAIFMFMFAINTLIYKDLMFTYNKISPIQTISEYKKKKIKWSDKSKMRIITNNSLAKQNSKCYNINIVKSKN